MTEVLPTNGTGWPARGDDRPSLLAIRVASGESAEWIVQRTEALLGSAQSEFSIATWSAPSNHKFETLPEHLTDFVRANVARGIDGEPEPDSG